VSAKTMSHLRNAQHECVKACEENAIIGCLFGVSHFEHCTALEPN